MISSIFLLIFILFALLSEKPTAKQICITIKTIQQAGAVAWCTAHSRQNRPAQSQGRYTVHFLPMSNLEAFRGSTFKSTLTKLKPSFLYSLPIRASHLWLMMLLFVPALQQLLPNCHGCIWNLPTGPWKFS